MRGCGEGAPGSDDNNKCPSSRIKPLAVLHGTYVSPHLVIMAVVFLCNPRSSGTRDLVETMCKVVSIDTNEQWSKAAIHQSLVPLWA